MPSLTYGLQEEKVARQTISEHLLSENSPYSEAINEFKLLLSGAKQTLSDQTGTFATACIRSVIIDCEEAKAWVTRHREGKPDFWSDRVAYDDVRVDDLQRAIRSLKKLRILDQRQPYWIRQAFAEALVKQAPKGVGFDATFADPNREDGGLRVSISSEVREHLEPQFLMQASLHKFDSVLLAAIERLQRFAQRRGDPWRWVGNLYVDPPISRRAKGSIRRDADDMLGIATLGLSASLSAIFRLISDGVMPRRRYSGSKMPSSGKPNWALVADFVNATWPEMKPVSAEDLRQRWNQFSRGRDISLHNWPGSAIRQPQLQNESRAAD